MPFIAGRVIVFFIETGLMVFLVDHMGYHNMISKSGVTVLVIILNYFISKFAVFRKK
jgi:putative flippase GtrA